MRKVRKYLQTSGVCQAFWLKLQPSRNIEFMVPIAPWVIPKEKQTLFLDTMANLKLFLKYVSRF
jgi:hypothetical protein